MTYEELTEGDDPVIKSGTLMKNVTRKNIERVHQGKGEGNYALYAYDSLPPKYKARFVARYGNPEESMRREALRDLAVTDEAARAWYEEYTYDLNGTMTHLTEKQVAEYTANASVLGLLWKRMEDLRAMTAAQGGGRRSDLWDIVQERCEALREVMGHTLPANLPRLKERMNRYRKEGYASVVSGRLGNKNTLKITEDGARRLVALKRSRVPVYTERQILETYNAESAARGWKPLKSQRSLRAWLHSPEVEPLWHDAVFGEMSAHQKFDRRHKTELPALRDALWYGDGTKVNLYYRDEDGHTRTTCVYEVMDAATEVLLGYHISDTEDYKAQYMAYRMAVRVSGHKPYEIVHDNQGGHKKANSGQMLDKICRIHRPTAPYNPTSKTIEAVFGRFQREVLGKDWRFTGQNITAKRAESRPNLEFLAANRDSLYTLEELKAAYAQARDEWNSMPHPATGTPRMEMYTRSVNPQTPALCAADMVDIFWVECRRMSTFTSGGIRVTIDGREHTYEVMAEAGVPDIEWRRTNTWRKFVVKYDPCDLGSVRLYRKDKSGELRFERVAEPYMVIHRAKQDQTEEEAAFIRAQRLASEESRLERLLAAKEIEHAEGVSPERHGLASPIPMGAGKAMKRELERRTRKYSDRIEELSPGRHAKRISNLDLAELEEAGTPVVELRKVAGKI